MTNYSNSRLSVQEILPENCVLFSISTCAIFPRYLLIQIMIALLSSNVSRLSYWKDGKNESWKTNVMILHSEWRSTQKVTRLLKTYEKAYTNTHVRFFFPFSSGTILRDVFNRDPTQNQVSYLSPAGLYDLYINSMMLQHVSMRTACELWFMIPLQQAFPSIIALSPGFNRCRGVLWSYAPL
jgi:hypothetical protein